ncbi:hypothetical protein PVW46_21505 [Mameliella sp. AT18]|uniref:hypothetical protein n=1 Tax=Mameliella sp. AT18 TaxID=3028385 RepID=UPI00237C012F|nr:hypothetical protein [Mameliella sp. AT18]MDD9732483.1 hypothetical protein [Mameliella sp. AT18]
MTELDKNDLLEAFDEFAVSERKVKATLGITKRAINKEIKKGTFPMPIMIMNGMRYWRLGDMARYEKGWA